MLQSQEKILKVFFNANAELFDDVALISPVPWFHQLICLNGKVDVSFTGWFQFAKVTHQNISFTSITCGQGTRIVDALLALQGIVKHVVMLGLAGSLDESLGIGEVASPDFADHMELAPMYPRSELAPDLSFARASRVLTLDGLLLEDRVLLSRAASLGFQLIDIETYYFFKYASTLYKSWQAILTVTDLPLSKPFYTIDFKADELETPVSRILQSLGCYRPPK